MTLVVTVYIGAFFGEPGGGLRGVGGGLVSPKPPWIKECDVWILISLGSIRDFL